MNAYVNYSLVCSLNIASREPHNQFTTNTLHAETPRHFNFFRPCTRLICILNLRVLH